jgi:hypothetical protein
MKNEFAGMPADETPKNYEELSASYPRVKYHGDGRIRTIHVPEHEEMLGAGWYDSPADIPDHELVKPEETPADGSCPSCGAMQKALAEQEEKFNGAWSELVQHNRELTNDLEAANARIAELEAGAADVAAEPEAETGEPEAETGDTNVVGPAATDAGAIATDAAESTEAAPKAAPKATRRKSQPQQ